MTFEIVEEWILILIPLFLVWAFVVVDIVRQTGLSTRAKWIWVPLVTIVWPMLIVYWLTRPMPGRAMSLSAASRDYPQARLVDGALDHESGRIDDAQMSALEATLRRNRP
jgi:hypothetical protein